MKILLFITGLSVGGAERQVVDLADSFVSAGHEVIVVAMSGLVVVRPRCEKIAIKNLNIEKSILGALKGYIVFRKIVTEFKPDVVHSHLKHANLFARLLRLSLPLRCLISTSHTSNEGGALWMRLYGCTDWLANLTTCVSADVRSSLLSGRAAPAHKLIVMPNGINITNFQFNSESRDHLRKELLDDIHVKVFLSIGRLTEAKDYPNLLNAFTFLGVKCNAMLWIVGDGPLRTSLEELAKCLGIHNRVIFLGSRNDVANIYSAADIFVLSSAWEGFGLVVAEAMLCERPIIATDVGAVSEVLAAGGWLVPPKNSVALATAMANALNASQETISMMAQTGRDRILKNYSTVEIAARWVNIYFNYISQQVKINQSVKTCSVMLDKTDKETSRGKG
jgi:glycosyltransferase involved in cell wall biosynthesis